MFANKALSNTKQITMNNELTTNVQNNLLTAATHAANAHSKSTNRAYKNDLQLLQSYATQNGITVMDNNLNIVAQITPAFICGFLGNLISAGYNKKNGTPEQYKPATLNRLLATIGAASKAAGFETPVNKAARLVVSGYAKTLSNNTPYKQKQAEALKSNEITKAIHLNTFEKNTTPIRAIRDKAIVLIGFAACLRRNEIAQLKFADLIFDTDGVTIKVNNAKTGDYTKYVYSAHDTEVCPVFAVKKWIAKAGITKTDYLFTTITKGDKIDKAQHIAGQTVQRILQKYFNGDGKTYTGHSLRVGFAVSAKIKGSSINDIQIAGAWKSAGMVNRYTEPVTAKQQAIKLF